MNAPGESLRRASSRWARPASATPAWSSATPSRCAGSRCPSCPPGPRRCGSCRSPTCTSCRAQRTQDRLGARPGPAGAGPRREHRRQPRRPPTRCPARCARWSRCSTSPACSSWGPTTTTAPTPKNPARYLTRRHAAGPGRVRGCPLEDLRAGHAPRRLDRPRQRPGRAPRRRAARSSSSAPTTPTSATTGMPRWRVPPPHAADADDRGDPRALPAGARPDGGGRGAPAHRRPHPRRPAARCPSTARW